MVAANASAGMRLGSRRCELDISWHTLIRINCSCVARGWSRGGSDDVRVEGTFSHFQPLKVENLVEMTYLADRTLNIKKISG